MLQERQVEELIAMVGGLDRKGLIRQFASFRARFPLDFTSEFLNNTSIDRLRHIFVAMCLQCKRVPSVSAA